MAARTAASDAADGPAFSAAHSYLMGLKRFAGGRGAGDHRVERIEAEWEAEAVLGLRDSLWCWHGIRPDACGGQTALDARLERMFDLTRPGHAQAVIDAAAGYAECYASAPTP